MENNHNQQNTTIFFLDYQRLTSIVCAAATRFGSYFCKAKEFVLNRMHGNAALLQAGAPSWNGTSKGHWRPEADGNVSENMTPGKTYWG